MRSAGGGHGKPLLGELLSGGLQGAPVVPCAGRIAWSHVDWETIAAARVRSIPSVEALAAKRMAWGMQCRASLDSSRRRATVCRRWRSRSWCTAPCRKVSSVRHTHIRVAGSCLQARQRKWAGRDGVWQTASHGDAAVQCVQAPASPAQPPLSAPQLWQSLRRTASQRPKRCAFDPFIPAHLCTYAQASACPVPRPASVPAPWPQPASSVPVIR